MKEKEIFIVEHLFDLQGYGRVEFGVEEIGYFENEDDAKSYVEKYSCCKVYDKTMRYGKLRYRRESIPAKLTLNIPPDFKAMGFEEQKEG